MARNRVVRSFVGSAFGLALLGVGPQAQADETWLRQVDGLGGSLSNAYLPDNPKTSAIPITVIDRRMIEASGAQDIGDILRIVPGMVTGHRFGYQLAVGSQGNAEEYLRRTNIIIDGRSLFTPVVGGLLSFNMPVSIDEIERIEVYRGPSGSEFGGNSMMNTIRIYTASSMEKQGTKVRFVKNEKNGGSGYVRHGAQVGDVFITGSYMQSNDDGLHNRDDDMRRKRAFVRADYQVDDNNELTLTMGASGQDITTWVTSNPDSKNNEGQDKTYFINTTWVRSFENGSLITNFAHTYLDRDTYYLSAPVNPMIGRLRYETAYSFDSTTLESKIRKNLGDSVEVSLGGKIASDRAVSEELFLESEHRLNSGAAFGTADWTVREGTNLIVGTMYEATDMNSEVGLSYNFALIQRLTDRSQIRFGYNLGTRLPWLYEINAARKFYLHDRGDVVFYDVYNTEDLKTEKVVQRDVSWMFDDPVNGLSAEIRLYKTDYKSLIANAMTANPGVNSQNGAQVISFRSFSNPSSVKGVEASMTWQPNGDWMLAVSASYNDVDSYLDPNSFAGNAGEAGPTSTFSMLGERSFGPNWKVGGMFTRLPGYNWSNGWELESQEVLDLYVQRCFADIGVAGLCAKLAGSDMLGGKPDFRPEAYRAREYRAEVAFEF